MSSEKFQNACANICLAGTAAASAGLGLGTLWLIGEMVYDRIKIRRERKKQEKEEAAIDDEWEAYKLELDRMIEENSKLLAKTEQEIEG